MWGKSNSCNHHNWQYTVHPLCDGASTGNRFTERYHGIVQMAIVESGSRQKSSAGIENKLFNWPNLCYTRSQWGVGHTDNKDLCLCGDGRNDSPGHCASYCVSSILDHASKAVVDVAVLDKRECARNSTMEREALWRLFERLKYNLSIKKLCTDASSTIIKIVREMKGSFIFTFRN